MSESNVVQISDEKKVEMMRRFGITREELKVATKPLFFLMYDHGITTLDIERNGATLNLKINGKRVDI